MSGSRHTIVGMVLAAVGALLPGAVVAGDAASNAQAPAAAAEAASAMTDGEVVKVDASAGTVTLKHGDIPNLDMMAMTMVFKVADKRMLEGVKPGDKLRFRAERRGGSFVVTEWQIAR